MKKKYVFILSFDVKINNMSRGIVETVVQSNNKELYYSQVTEAKVIVRNSVEETTGARATGIVLLSCTRTLNDSL